MLSRNMLICGALLTLAVFYAETSAAKDVYTSRTRHLSYLNLIQDLELTGFHHQQAVTTVMKMMHLNQNEAGNFLDYMEKSNLKMVSKNQEISKQLLCPDQFNLQYISENAGTLTSAIIDIQDSYLYTAYSSVLTDFGKNTFNNLNMWLDSVYVTHNEPAAVVDLNGLLSVCRQVALSAQP